MIRIKTTGGGSVLLNVHQITLAEPGSNRSTTYVRFIHGDTIVNCDFASFSEQVLAAAPVTTIIG
jgi:hypothetical protein